MPPRTRPSIVYSSRNHYLCQLFTSFLISVYADMATDPLEVYRPPHDGKAVKGTSSVHYELGVNIVVA